MIMTVVQNHKSWHPSCLRDAAGMLLAVVALTSGCCAPDHYFGPVRVLTTTVAPGMPDTSVTIYVTAYDTRNKRAAIGHSETVDNKTVFVRNILDYGKGMEYEVTGWYYTPDPHPKCTMYPLHAPWRNGACVPANATKSQGFYMGHPSGPYLQQMDAVAFTYTQGSLTAKVMVTQDSCLLVGEAVYDTSDPAATRVINRLYVNQTTYATDDFFKLPNVTCVPNPNPPKVSPWERMAKFGWLLGMPDN